MMLHLELVMCVFRVGLLTENIKDVWLYEKLFLKGNLVIAFTGICILLIMKRSF
jgi:hypothetical protein